MSQLPEPTEPSIEQSAIEPLSEATRPTLGTKLFVIFFMLIVPPLGILVLAAMVWSWAQGEPSAAGSCAFLAGDGRFHAGDCDATRHFACAGHGLSARGCLHLSENAANVAADSRGAYRKGAGHLLVRPPRCNQLEDGLFTWR